MQTGDREPYVTVRTPTRAMTLPVLASEVAVTFWFLMACSVQKGQTVESPQPLACFLGVQPGSSSPEQLVPGTLTVLSPRKKLVLKKQCLLPEMQSCQVHRSSMPPCWFEGIFLLVCGYPAGSMVYPSTANVDFL